MKGTDLVEQMEIAHRRLAQHPALIRVSAIRRAPPLSEEEMRAVEGRLGFSLPALLRDFYVHAAGSIEFDFDAQDEAWDAAGFGDPWGTRLGIVEGRSLCIRPWLPGLVQITADARHDGWYLDAREHREPMPLVWIYHDRLDRPREPEMASFDELAAALVTGMMYRGAPPVIESLIQTGDLRPRRRAPRPPRS